MVADPDASMDYFAAKHKVKVGISVISRADSRRNWVLGSPLSGLWLGGRQRWFQGARSASLEAMLSHSAEAQQESNCQ
jgi:hypothetical protein